MGRKRSKVLRRKNSFSSQRVSIIGGYTPKQKSLKALMEFNGYTDTSIFSHWVEHFLCSVISKGDVVIMDNASFHKNHRIQELIEAKGARLLFLPTYSPDLNPIEKCWANFKRALRKIIKQAKSFKDAITEALYQTYPGYL